MANLMNENDPAYDRKQLEKEGSSVSGSKLRNNVATEKTLQPNRNAEPAEEVDQDPAERQKKNQNQTKDDPLAA